MFKRFMIQYILLLATVGAAHAAPRLELGQTAGSGDTIMVPVLLATDQGASVAALGVDIGYDSAALEKPTAAAGPVAAAAGKVVTVSYPSSGMVRLGVLGYNTKTLGNGVVAVITFKRKSRGGGAPLDFKFAASAANSTGDAVSVDTADGIITIK